MLRCPLPEHNGLEAREARVFGCIRGSSGTPRWVGWGASAAHQPTCIKTASQHSPDVVVAWRTCLCQVPVKRAHHQAVVVLDACGQGHTQALGGLTEAAHPYRGRGPAGGAPSTGVGLRERGHTPAGASGWMMKGQCGGGCIGRGFARLLGLAEVAHPWGGGGPGGREVGTRQEVEGEVGVALSGFS